VSIANLAWCIPPLDSLGFSYFFNLMGTMFQPRAYIRMVPLAASTYAHIHAIACGIMRCRHGCGHCRAEHTQHQEKRKYLFHCNRVIGINIQLIG